MEGFPAPDAKTTMEAMEDDESERTSANLGEDERQDREIALVSDQRKRLTVRMKMMLKKLLDVVCVPCGEQSVMNFFNELDSELVGDVQLAGDGVDKEEDDVSEESTQFDDERPWSYRQLMGSEMAIKVFERQVRDEHECREWKRRQTIGGYCCTNGFLRRENHQ